MSNSHSGAGLRLIQSSGEQPRKFEFVPDSNPAPDVFNPEPQTPVGGSRVKDPLLTAEEVAERLNGYEGLGLGPFVPQITPSPCYPHGRRDSALSGQQNRGIHRQAGTSHQSAPQTWVK
jgi:hypothetical protein